MKSTIRHRVSLSLLLVLGLLAALVMTTAHNLLRQQGGVLETQEHMEALTRLEQIEELLMENLHEQLRYGYFRDQDPVARLEQVHRQMTGAIAALQRMPAMPETARMALMALGEESEKTPRIMAEMMVAQQFEDQEGVARLFEELDQNVRQITRLTEGVRGAVLSLSASASGRRYKNALGSFWLLLGLTVFTLAVTVATAVRLNSRLVNPMEALMAVPDRIRRGDYRSPIAVPRHAPYEIKQLAGSLFNLQTNLAQEQERRRVQEEHRAEAETQLIYSAFHDSLTGLANRALFFEHLSKTVARAQRHPDQVFALIYLDLDRFKVVNDGMGHHVGDELLKHVSRRLEHLLRKTDTLARMGGDEFTLLLDSLERPQDAPLVAGRIQYALGQPYHLDGREVHTSCSLGVVVYQPGYTSAEEMLRDADIALRRAKHKGKARFEIFDNEMHAQAQADHDLEMALRGALQRGEFQVHYQPVTNLQNGSTVEGLEALARWKNQQDEWISPARFIPVAEESGLILPLGWWVLKQACRDLVRFNQQAGRETPVWISVNLSPRQLLQPDVVARVRETLAQTRANPALLKLEVTESAVMEEMDLVIERLGQLRALGVRVFLDDFGTGYSSLAHLHRLPVDGLKIDRSFVSRLEQEGEDSAVFVKNMLGLAADMRLQTVAEGIETPRQAQWLKTKGCQSGQGFFFARPMPASQALHEITRATAPPSRSAKVTPLFGDGAPG